MSVDGDRMTRILLEVAINRTAKNPQDTAEEAALRKTLVEQCDEIQRKGGTVDIPGEIP